MKSKKENIRIEQNSSSRREFLKLLGFGAGVAAILPACEQPIRKMIPYLIQPEEVIPGKAFHYATTFKQGNFICPVVVKSRDGRPVKIEGNELSDITKGGTNARVQASVLDLYNPGRIQNPLIKNNRASWEETEKQIVSLFEKESDREIVMISETITSPSEKKLIEQLISKYPNIKHFEIDFISNEAIRIANEKSFGLHKIPTYNLENPDIIVGFNCDFLGSWISPVEFSKQYSNRKNPDNNLIRHIQFETTVTITGAAADSRYPINPSEEKVLLFDLLKQIQKIGNGTNPDSIYSKYNINNLAKELFNKNGKSLVISGTNSVEIQLLVNTINYELGNYGEVINFLKEYSNFNGKSENLEIVKDGFANNKFAGAIFYQFDPGFYFGNSSKTLIQIENLDFSVFIGMFPPEKQEIFTFILPTNHYLESWSDSEIKTGSFSLGQPLIQPLFNTKQAEEILLKWCGQEILYHDFLKTFWETEIYLNVNSNLSFPDFWNITLQKGIFYIENQLINNDVMLSGNIDHNEIQPDVNSEIDSVEVHLIESSIFGTGSQVCNPWLLELPDPVTKQCWGNAALISPQLAKKYELVNGQLIYIKTNQKTIKIPVLILPGQAENTISIALGFGKENTPLNNFGENVFRLVYIENGLQKLNFTAEIEKTEVIEELALGQLYDSTHNRDLIRNISINDIQKEHKKKHSPKIEEYPSFYDEIDFPGYHWGLAVDLNKCTGCSTCVIACQSENNTPVVGKTEVIRKHEMHWLRVDRYFEGDEKNPKMLVQPVMCQHCDHAPCENVCPVSATTHSTEGINQMVYNRCIGTRYCANNCPYKVRRFNWFDYSNSDVYKNNEVIVPGMESNLVRMVLNPDVTVRSRGVIEKCSFCIQRIVEGKNNAKLENRPANDGEIKMACEQSCPSDALVFGNMNDPESKISKLINNNRSYRLLEELSTLPSVFYQSKIINDKS